MIAPSNSGVLKSALLSVLRQQLSSKEIIENLVPASDAERDRLLSDIVIASNAHWLGDTLDLLDQVWDLKQSKKIKKSSAQSWAQIEPSLKYKGTTVAVWRGDITQVNVDAIVNAANDSGLGCFVPEHKGIDNVIHRAAGPRLRMACRDAMEKRGGKPLSAGVPPLVTPSFALSNCSHILHVTGPQIRTRAANKSFVSVRDQELLASAYWTCLTAAMKHNLRSIAFPCISTGLFGFPNDLAADISLTTVQKWIDKHPGQLDAIVMNVFTPLDELLYKEKFERALSAVDPGNSLSIIREPGQQGESRHATTVKLARRWIHGADAILICAGAGMSVKEGEMVYTNPVDFRLHYPELVRWGYHTAYEAMGLEADSSVPTSAKWAFWAKHMHNMRWKFAPNDGYHTLRELIGGKDAFVLTSNVDGCFVRSGFPSDRIYTPQGEWTYLQCRDACRSDSVFESRPYLDSLLSYMDTHKDNNGHIPDHLIPKCPNCGGTMFGNVRGGSWFLHDEKFKEQNENLQNWMSHLVAIDANVVVLEIGAGFNTPSVTRLPMEAFCLQSGGKRRLIRINPTDPEVPSDLKALSIDQGWEVLAEIALVNVDLCTDKESEYYDPRNEEGEHAKKSMSTAHYQSNFGGGFHWKHFLTQLRD